jgi:hypothetical protein
MSNTIVLANSPKQLIVITPTADGNVIITGYQVAIIDVSLGEPLVSDAGWQAPDVDGTDSGILVGSAGQGHGAAPKVFTAGKTAMPYALVTTAGQQVIVPCPPAVNFI